MSGKVYKVGVVGSTGAVGKEFPTNDENLTLFASHRSAGKELETPYGKKIITEFSVEAAREMDYVFLAVSGSFAEQNAPQIAEKGGAVVIDNSSAFRYKPEIPLVIPEINAHTMAGETLIANPNCTTAIAAMALWPLYKAKGLEKVIVSTYQASSGAGAEGMDELEDGLRSWAKGEKIENKVFAHQLPFNVIPHIDKFQPNGYTKEEMKVTWETQKIFGDASIECSCTAVRIPTLRAHSEAITIKTRLPINPEEARMLLGCAPGVVVVDEPEKNAYPMPLNATAKDDVEVGRIRQSLVFGEYGLDLFVSGDQLLRGAALNAVLIGEAHYRGESAMVKQEVEWVKQKKLEKAGKLALGVVGIGALVGGLMMLVKKSK